ncbi:MAG: universal stress protein [Humibacillus sp.]|nr:universal stress protein [Humibacillus sp.]MDN5777317.1 universal stress protein [Humibacillus sp.]
MTVIKNCVIVAVDDSPASRVAHRWAASYARATATDLCAVHVLDWPIGLVGSAGEPRTRLYVPARQVDPTYRDRLQRVLDDTDTGADAEMNTQMNTQMDAARHPAAGSTLHFAQGLVGEVLVRLSTHATLLVIGTREPHHGGQRFVTGSASHYCVSHATCPVVTVPEQPVGGPARDSTSTGEEDVMPRDPELAPCR